MADIVIRSGTVIDGTGSPPFVADIAIIDGKISAIGPNLQVHGKEEVNATGLHVTPGWVDPHTHLDAQWSWDPYMSPVASVGVTTAIMGNCGIGFAPCQNDRRDFLRKLMEAVEDIPGDIVADKMKYDFETFEEYMDSIERTRLACDVAVMIGHSAVRTWVMGKRASLADRPGGPRDNPVHPKEIEAMAALVQDAVSSGAIGFSTSRLLVHRDPQGQLTPGALAGEEECRAICKAIVDGGGGIFEMSTDWSSYDDIAYSKLDHSLVKAYQEREANWMVDIAAKYTNKISFTYNVFPSPAMTGLKAIERINKAGSLAMGQSFLRLQGFLFHFDARMHPFLPIKAFQKLAKKCVADGLPLIQVLQEQQNRAQILQEAREMYTSRNPNTNPRLRELLKFFKPFTMLFEYTVGYEPDPNVHSMQAIAAQKGLHPVDVIYDHMAAGGILWKPQLGLYPDGNMDRNMDFVMREDIVPGFSDGGAHGTMIQDAAAATHSITHWVRDRHQGSGRRIPIEIVVKKHSADVAKLFGLTDVGTLKLGMKANLNVFDLNKLAVHDPHIVEDWMKRWVQDVGGYMLTLVNGVPTYRAGKPTGALPGALVRNPRSDRSKYRGIAHKVSAAFDGFVPDFEDNGTSSVDGMGEKGGSAANRLLRETIELDNIPSSKL